jgi:hypothetical protein
VETAQKFLKFLVFLRRPSKLEQHVFQEDVIARTAAIMLGLRFRSSIAVQLDELLVINMLRYQGPSAAAGYGLRLGRAERKAKSEGSKCERDNSVLARHEGSIRT